MDETLEKLCLEGNRKQAKYAVSAISVLAADSGLKTLSLLYAVCLNLSFVAQIRQLNRSCHAFCAWYGVVQVNS